MATRGKRHRRWWSCLLLVLCAVNVPAARQLRTSETESLRVVVDSEWVQRAAPGYWPIRLDITNLGGARVIEIVAQGSRFFRSYPGGQSQATARQFVRMEPNDRVRLTMPVPIFADNETIRVELLEGDRVIERFTAGGTQSRMAAANASVLFVADPSSSLGAIAGSISRRFGRGGSITTLGASGSSVSFGAPPPTSVRMPSMDLQLEPARLPANWIAFTSVRAVAIGPDEWDLLNDGQKSALLTWTASGGELIFVDGVLDALLPGTRGEPASEPDRIVGRHFFGRVHVLTSASLAAAGIAGLLASTQKSIDLLRALPANTTPDWGAIEARGFRLSIPGVNGVPARTFLVILLLFSLVIGPASYWFLRRRGQLVLLVLTAPVISLASIALLTGYALADEGFRVRGRAMTFTMLDQVKKQSVTRATVSLYTPGLSPTAGLRFSRDTAVFPLGGDGSGTRERMTLDLTESQAFTQGLLATRAPTNFEQVAFRPARERLTFSRSAAGLTVTNGLDSSVVALRYRDGDTLYGLDGPLPSGGQQTMKPIAAADAVPANVPAKFLSTFEDQAAGSYLALLDRSPFWEPGMAGVLEDGSLHIVLGWPEGQR